MITKIVKDVASQTFNELKEIETKLEYFNEISKKGIGHFTKKEIESLQLEFLKFFNVHFSILADTYPQQLFRVSNNKRILKEKEGRLSNISQLLGPPPGMSSFGRCNLPGESVFYCSLDLETAIWETQPNVGDFITVSEWKIKEGQCLWTHNVFHPSISNVSQDSINALEAWLKLKDGIEPNSRDIYEALLIYLTNEFMKVVSIPENYLFTGLHSSELIQSPPDGNGFKIEAIAYPSVKKEYGLTNLAICNDLVLEKLDLVEVSIYKVEETFFDKAPQEDDVYIEFSAYVFRTNSFDHDNDLIIYDHDKELEMILAVNKEHGL